MGDLLSVLWEETGWFGSAAVDQREQEYVDENGFTRKMLHYIRSAALVDVQEKLQADNSFLRELVPT